MSLVTSMQYAALEKKRPVVNTQSTAGGKVSAALVKTEKTGQFGDGGEPAVEITVRISNMPKNAKLLAGVIHTNKDWEAGGCPAKGNGEYKFTAYLSKGNVFSPFRIDIYDEKGNTIASVPGTNSYMKIPFPY